MSDALNKKLTLYLFIYHITEMSQNLISKEERQNCLKFNVAIIWIIFFWKIFQILHGEKFIAKGTKTFNNK